MRVAIYARVSAIIKVQFQCKLRKALEYAKSETGLITYLMKDIASGAKQRPQRDDILKRAD
jgi:hypothetical protein